LKKLPTNEDKTHFIIHTVVPLGGGEWHE
jgi:hypothetical protein